jgi:hypothetical protein
MTDDMDKARAEGREEGRIAEILRRHEDHFSTINGSIEKSKDAMIVLASEIRGLREDARIRDERVQVAADTLATETERRREELAGTVDQADRLTASSEHKFTRRERLGALVMTAALAVIGYLLGR